MAEQLSSERTDKFILGEYWPGVGEIDDKMMEVMEKGGNKPAAHMRVKRQGLDFFNGLQGIFVSNCKGLTPSMKL